MRGSINQTSAVRAATAGARARGAEPPAQRRQGSQLRRSAARGLEVLRAFKPTDGMLGNQEIAARTKLLKPTVSRLTYTLTQLGYLTHLARLERYQLAPAALALGYAALAQIGARLNAIANFRESEAPQYSIN